MDQKHLISGEKLSMIKQCELTLIILSADKTHTHTIFFVCLRPDYKQRGFISRATWSSDFRPQAGQYRSYPAGRDWRPAEISEWCSTASQRPTQNQHEKEEREPI